jgi:nitric oxide reductase NorQ protein
VDKEMAVGLVTVGEKVRNLKNHGLEEGVSTRLLIYAGELVGKGVSPQAACEAAIIRPITDDADMQRSLREIVTAVF